MGRRIHKYANAHHHHQQSRHSIVYSLLTFSIYIFSDESVRREYILISFSNIFVLFTNDIHRHKAQKGDANFLKCYCLINKTVVNLHFYFLPQYHYHSKHLLTQMYTKLQIYTLHIYVPIEEVMVHNTCPFASESCRLIVKGLVQRCFHAATVGSKMFDVITIASIYTHTRTNCHKMGKKYTLY